MQAHLSDLEKALYNKHLAISRSVKNKPFKIKKDFSDIVDTEKHKYLTKISIFVRKHPDIDLNLFFKAPYMLYPDVQYFGLDYFSTLRAIKSYTLYKKQIFLQSPDEQIEEIKRSLKFIADFCIKNRIYFFQYAQHKTSDLYTWMLHYKENKINIYAMFEFPNIFSSVKSLAEDMQRFFVSDFVDQFQNLHSKYNNSTHAKPFLKKAVAVLSNFVEKSVANPKKTSNINSYEQN